MSPDVAYFQTHTKAVCPPAQAERDAIMAGNLACTRSRPCAPAWAANTAT
jgi:hypothetical protein